MITAAKHWRINLVIVFFCGIGIFIAINLARLQIFNYQYWSALAQGQQNQFEDVSGPRGQIYLQGDTLPVATNRDSFFVYVSPPAIKDAGAVEDFLSSTLQMATTDIAADLGQKDSSFVIVKKDLSDSEISTIKQSKLAGIYLEQQSERFYPQNALASNILGFVDSSGNGQYGVEGYYNNQLSGKDGVQQLQKSAFGFLPFSGANAESVSGTNLTLTIDYNIQFMAEKLLAQAHDTYKMDSGQIIVADPNTGAVLAMAQYPNFNPNNFSDYASGDMSVFQNAATQQLFEPGSALKPVTMAIGLQEGKITPQTTYTDEGFVKFGNQIVSNYAHAKYGVQTMTQVLEKSINTGAVFVEEQIPHNVFLNYLGEFGLFEKTGIDLPEVYSDNAQLKKGYDINLATASFGQGISMTPIQLVRAISAIANGGKLPTPYVVASETENGQTQETQPELSDPIISEKTASQVAAMMVSVTQNGFGKTAAIPGYYIAGKTGTAQVPIPGGYSSDKTIQSFIGFAPAFNPKFIILVKLDNPNTSDSEFSAGPVFHDLASYIINLWQIPPDYKQ